MVSERSANRNPVRFMVSERSADGNPAGFMFSERSAGRVRRSSCRQNVLPAPICTPSGRTFRRKGLDFYLMRLENPGFVCNFVSDP
jgi:hypothetical protein